ncbi:MAG: hypothetical protein EZS28_000582 [Streblomastix strix]|uniref:Uncharacterized protein n=1 Tax=Streblomastix strix TaxID=222440 RepID=A0A5J4XBJ8_9EUKA|nr:MAG: hypothetical protein EZS28_000582 [Streblomastix strix]
MTEMKRTYSEQKQDFKIENKEIKISVESIQSEIPSELQLNSKPVEDPLSLQISINNEDVDNELLRDAADEVEGEEGLDGTISNNRNQTNGQSDDEEDDVCEDANAQQVQEQAKAERRMRDWVTYMNQQQNIPLNPIVSNPSLYYTALAQQQRMISSQTGSGINGDEELKEKEDKSDLVSVRSHISTHTQRTSTMPSLSSVAETQDAEDQDDKQIFEKERLLTKDEVPKEKELNLNIQKLKDKEKDSIKEDLSDKLSIYSHISTTTTRTAGMWSVASAKTAHTLQTTISKDSGGSGGSHLVPQNVLPYPGYVR